VVGTSGAAGAGEGAEGEGEGAEGEGAEGEGAGAEGEGEGDLPCLDLWDCAVDCGDDEACQAGCLAQGTREGQARYEALLRCALTHCNARPEPLDPCTLASCLPETLACGGPFCGDGICSSNREDVEETGETCPADCHPPDNDRCEAAAPLQLGVETTGDTSSAGRELLVARGPDVWYLLELERAARVEIRLESLLQPWNTYLYLLSGSCERRTIVAENDDTGERRDLSVILRDLAPGRYFVVVTGREVADAGAYRLRARAVGEDDRPLLERATATLASDGARLGLHVEGRDPQGDVTLVRFELLDAQGEPLLWGWQLEAALTGVSWDAATSRFHATAVYGFRWPVVGATSVSLQLVDATGLQSDVLVVPLQPPSEAGLGQPCDPEGIFSTCQGDLLCLTAEDGAARCLQTDRRCPDAWLVVDLDLLREGDRVRYTGDTSGSLLDVHGSCAGGTGAVAHRFTMPATGDLVVSTAESARDADTVVFARQACTLAETELGCNDDIRTGWVRTSSLLLTDVPEGEELFLFVDGFQDEDSRWAGPYVLTLQVRRDP